MSSHHELIACDLRYVIGELNRIAERAQNNHVHFNLLVTHDGKKHAFSREAIFEVNSIYFTETL